MCIRDREAATALAPFVSRAAFTDASGPSRRTVPRVAHARVMPLLSTVVIWPSPYVAVEGVPPICLAIQVVAAATSLTLAMTTTPRSGALTDDGSSGLRPPGPARRA